MHKLQAEQAEAGHTFQVVSTFEISNDEEYEEATTLLKAVKAKAKFWEQERKVSVEPLNQELKRINGFFKPVTNKLEEIEAALKRIIGAYTLRKHQEQQRLLVEAAEAARKAAAEQTVTQDAPDNTQTLALMAEAQAVAAPRIAGIGVKEVIDWELIDPNAVPEIYKSVDKAKVDAAIKAGARDIPGLRIFKTARVSARG